MSFKPLPSTVKFFTTTRQRVEESLFLRDLSWEGGVLCRSQSVPHVVRLSIMLPHLHFEVNTDLFHGLQ